MSKKQKRQLAKRVIEIGLDENGAKLWRERYIFSRASGVGEVFIRDRTYYGSSLEYRLYGRSSNLNHGRAKRRTA